MLSTESENVSSAVLFVLATPTDQTKRSFGQKSAQEESVTCTWRLLRGFSFFTSPRISSTHLTFVLQVTDFSDSLYSTTHTKTQNIYLKPSEIFYILILM